MKIKLSLLFICMSVGLFAQEQLSLDNMDSFRSQAGNWKIVGNVLVDRNIDVHANDITPENDTKKRKRKNKKKLADIPKPVSIEEGNGILFNNYNAAQKDHLLTKWEHGDLKLELEVMIPKGSNSGIYLQGRYELQIKDSWGVSLPKHNDLGGIHRNWEEEPSKIFRGIAPISNAAKAPGLWQKLSIHFQAPKFNAQGDKISNAKFVSVELNGIQIHNNVEVPLPTGGPISKEETTRGPLLIQGDHGPMAFKNIKYQLLRDSDVEITSLKYKTYKNIFRGLEDIDTNESSLEKEAEFIDINVVDEEDNLGIQYTGILNIKEQDDYTISVGYTGGIDFILDGNSILKKNSPSDQGTLNATVALAPGQHPFTLTNIKSAGWRAPRLGLTIKGSNTNPKKFHTLDSYPPLVNSVSPIYVEAAAKPVLLRGFVNFRGNEKRLSHTIGVGTPEGLNFVYDLAAANIIGVWRGDFVNATPMWHSRGNGSFTPKGAVQWTFLSRPVAALNTMQTAFPETATSDFKALGYAIAANTGLPVFKSEYKGVTIENTITPSENNTHFIHKIKFSDVAATNWYYKIASGNITSLKDGSFAINNQEYYVQVLSGQKATIRTINGTSELIIPVDGRTINYEIIW